MELGDGAFGRRLGQEAGGFMNAISVLVVETPERTQGEDSHL